MELNTIDILKEQIVVLQAKIEENIEDSKKVAIWEAEIKDINYRLRKIGSDSSTISLTGDIKYCPKCNGLGNRTVLGTEDLENLDTADLNVYQIRCHHCDGWGVISE